MTTAAGPRERRGGAWLIDSDAVEIFTPEQLSEEHLLIGRTAEEFAEKEVLAELPRLETKDWELARQLLRGCGALGLLGTDVPEAHGGVELDMVSAVVVAEAMARTGSFGSTFGAQTGLTIMPLLCFGTAEQQARYLPRLVSGELAGAYALSESGSGSDALGARARAVRRDDGSFALSGEKMWITNCAFADLFVVFAKVDGEHFTAFLVERGFKGVSTGKEEHKMGLHGSSTAPLVLEDVPVPASNVLGEVGKGHKVAFNVLNYGRFKLGAMTGGTAKHAIGLAARYAASRKQFGQPIASFGAIKFKLSEMIVRTFAVESALYRMAGSLDALLAEAGSHEGPALLAALEEFAIEASMAKVAGSEALHYVLDENVQIHGGNGYVADYPAERMYRDSRVNRIFEGTNEINRLLIPTLFVRRALKGQLPLLAAYKDVTAARDADATDAACESDAPALADRFRQIAILVLGAAAQRYGDRLADQQEVLCWSADILMDTYLTQSAVLRWRRAAADQRPTAGLQEGLVQVLVGDAATRIEAAALQAVAALDGRDADTLVERVRRLLARTPVDTVAPRRRLADAAIQRGGYPFAAAR
jgi:alkylation response protein AidB-like acyl-CoA dehydrogenase